MTHGEWSWYRKRLTQLKRWAIAAHQAGEYARRNELCKQHDDLVLEHERRLQQLPLKVAA